MAAPSAAPSMPISSRRQQLESLRRQLENDYEPFKAIHRELAQFIKPRRVRFNTAESGKSDLRAHKILNGAATFAANTLAAGITSGVTNPARPWFRLTTSVPAIAQQDDVKDWLHTVSQEMESMFLRSNLYQELPILYGDMGVFGTGAMAMLEHPTFGMRFQTFPVGSYWIGVDQDNRTAVFARQLTMTVRQLLDEFGHTNASGEIVNWANFSPAVKSAVSDGQLQRQMRVVHLICPNRQYDPGKALSKYKKFYSVYYETGGSANGSGSPPMSPNGPITPAGTSSSTRATTGSTHPDDVFLREEGFDEFPIAAGRWELGGDDVYATDCPGMTALGDVKQLQGGERSRLKAIDKLVDPPMQGPPELRQSGGSLIPGDITYVVQGPQGGFKPVYEIDPKLDHLLKIQQEVEQRINKAFYTDMFLMWSESDRRDITATEVIERREEKLVVLGPVLGRINDDILEPLIDRAFAIMLRQGRVPPAPPAIQGMALTVEYVSIMAAAQKSTGLAALNQTATFALQLAQVQPDVLDKLDFDELIADFADASGVPPKVIRDDQAVQQIRTQRQQQQQAAQQAQGAVALSQGAKNLAQAPLNGGNALEALLGSSGLTSNPGAAANVAA